MPTVDKHIRKITLDNRELTKIEDSESTVLWENKNKRATLYKKLEYIHFSGSEYIELPPIIYASDILTRNSSYQDVPYNIDGGYWSQIELSGNLYLPSTTTNLNSWFVFGLGLNDNEPVGSTNRFDFKFGKTLLFGTTTPYTISTTPTWSEKRPFFWCIGGGVNPSGLNDPQTVYNRIYGSWTSKSKYPDINTDTGFANINVANNNAGKKPVGLMCVLDQDGVASNCIEGNIYDISIKYYKRRDEGHYPERFELTNSPLVTFMLNLIPVQRKSDDVCGLYDEINDMFYPMKGTNITTAAKGTELGEECGKGAHDHLFYIEGTTCKEYDFKNKTITDWTVVNGNSNFSGSKFSGNNSGRWIMTTGNDYTTNSNYLMDFNYDTKTLTYTLDSNSKVNGNYGFGLNDHYYSGRANNNYNVYLNDTNDYAWTNTAFGSRANDSLICGNRLIFNGNLNSNNIGSGSFAKVWNQTTQAWDPYYLQGFPINLNFYNFWTWKDKLYVDQSTSHYVGSANGNSWDPGTSHTWNGQNNFHGARVFTDGESCYMVGGTSTGTTIYKLNESTDTWESYWTVPSAIRGDYFMTEDGSCQCGQTARNKNFKPIYAGPIIEFPSTEE